MTNEITRKWNSANQKARMRHYGSPWGRPSLQRANKGIEWKSIYHRTINNIFLPSEAMSDSENQPEKEAEVEKKVIGSALFQY